MGKRVPHHGAVLQSEGKFPQPAFIEHFLNFRVSFLMTLCLFRAFMPFMSFSLPIAQIQHLNELLQRGHSGEEMCEEGGNNHKENVNAASIF